MTYHEAAAQGFLSNAAAEHASAVQVYDAAVLVSTDLNALNIHKTTADGHAS